MDERQSDLCVQQEVVARLDFEAALAEDSRRRALGQRVVFMALGLNGASDLQLFTNEARGKILVDDEIGPVILQQASEHPVRGIAIWRNTEKSQSQNKQSIGLRSEKRVSEPIPRSMLNDQMIRQSMYEVLSWDTEQIITTTKQLAEADAQKLHSIELSLPIRLPSINDVGTHNALLKEFAFDAFDALHTYFGSPEEWDEWSVLPYFLEGDDTQESVFLGVFAQKTINQ